MNKQPEALRLADSLWALMSTVYSNGTLEASAAELRRLHAELERCKRVCAATSEAWREEAALAEPVQEPYAWMAVGGTIWRHKTSEDDVPLYTAPPQRKPLTEEEIDRIWDSEKAFADIYAIARAIERAHEIT